MNFKASKTLFVCVTKTTHKDLDFDDFGLKRKYTTVFCIDFLYKVASTRKLTLWATYIVTNECLRRYIEIPQIAPREIFGFE